MKEDYTSCPSSGGLPWPPQHAVLPSLLSNDLLVPGRHGPENRHQSTLPAQFRSFLAAPNKLGAVPPARKRITISDLLNSPLARQNMPPFQISISKQSSLAKIAPRNAFSPPVTPSITSASMASSASAAHTINSLASHRHVKRPLVSGDSFKHAPLTLPRRPSITPTVDSNSRASRRAKSTHNQAERARRQHLNEKINELQNLLPGASSTSTCETLQMAALYIDRLTAVTALFQRELSKVKGKR